MELENQDDVIKTISKNILKKINTPLNSMGIELTTYCPLDCFYCSRRWLDRKNKEMSWEQFMKVKENLSNIDRVILCGLGEPMIYSRIYDVLDELADKKVVIITSGTVEIDYVRLNKNDNVEVIIFSVDDPTEEGMYRISGGFYNWSNLMKNMDVNKRNRTVKMINCTVSEENYKSLPQLAEFAVRHKLQSVSYTKIITHEDSNSISKEVATDMQNYLDKARSIAERKGLIFTDSFTDLKCLCWGRIVPYIDINGNLYPCCHGLNMGYKVGNVFNYSISEIFAGEGYKLFKEGQTCFGNCPIFEDKIGKIKEIKNK